MAIAVSTIELINNLINARYADPGSFSEFAEKLKNLASPIFTMMSWLMMKFFVAGVVLCSVFLDHQRNVYLGVDGQTYREDY